MNRLELELQRLYASPDAAASVRGLILELSRPADWKRLSALCQGVQDELDLPAPAIAINGVDGYQIWFSLAEGVSTAQGLGFLEGLRLRYLPDVATQRIRLHLLNTLSPCPVPALQTTTGLCSAFVAPDLAAVFAEEPGLDLAPGADAQGDLLSRLVSVKPSAFATACERLGPLPSHLDSTFSASAHDSKVLPTTSPRAFLLDVMNNADLDMRWRIDAAKALLPYFERPPA
jgi:hypothetical protein